MKRVLFIFDRAAHYHVDMFQSLDLQLRERGVDLHLASGEVEDNAVGRVGVDGALIPNERKYRYTEKNVQGWMIRRVHGLRAMLAETSPQVVICLGHAGNLSHWWLALNKRRLGIRLVAWQCGYVYRDSALKRWALRQFVPRFDHHLAYHSNARDYALRYGAKPSQVTVMHNTINEERFELLPRATARERVCASHPAVGDRQIVLFVGALLQEKRVEVIIEAIGLLGRKDVVLVVVGDGPHRRRLETLAADRTDVVFCGAIVEGVGPYFDAATMFVMPGTGGLALNEAMAHTLPMLSGYADGSADDLVIDGETGYRLREGTAAELASKMSEFLDNPGAAARMGRRGRELITGKFAFRRFVECVANVIESEANHAP